MGRGTRNPGADKKRKRKPEEKGKRFVSRNGSNHSGQNGKMSRRKRKTAREKKQRVRTV